MTKLNSSSARIFASVIAGERDAATQLFHRYLRRLCRLAQTRIGARLAQRIDPEDVVMSAYRSFFLSAKAGRFWIQESGDLWALLTKIMLRKLYRSAAHHSAEIRCIDRETNDEASANLHEWVISEQPAAEEAVALADELESVLRALPNQHRRIIEMRLQGELIHDIANELEMSERTVRRVLADLESQLKQRHGLHEKEAIRVVARPAVNQPVAGAEKTEAIRRISFADLILKQLIGAGGMGKVYRAVSISTGKAFAVKFLRKELQDSPAIVERFLSEAAVVQRLKHEGLVRVEGIGQTKAGVWFIVMEIVEGQNLADKIAEELPAVEQSVFWIMQVAEALRVVHAAGVVHCDLKPANVLVSSDNRVVITDFGLARTARASTNFDTTFAGTAPWMAPEQIDPVFGSIDHRTDVYGLGALLFTLLTGHPPFEAARIPDVLAQIISQLPVPPSRMRPGISPQIDDLCLRCLAKFPDHRITSVTDFLRTIESSLPENTQIRRVE